MPGLQCNLFAVILIVQAVVFGLSAGSQLGGFYFRALPGGETYCIGNVILGTFNFLLSPLNSTYSTVVVVLRHLVTEISHLRARRSRRTSEPTSVAELELRSASAKSQGFCYLHWHIYHTISLDELPLRSMQEYAAELQGGVYESRLNLHMSWF